MFKFVLSYKFNLEQEQAEDVTLPSFKLFLQTT